MDEEDEELKFVCPVCHTDGDLHQVQRRETLRKCNGIKKSADGNIYWDSLSAPRKSVTFMTMYCCTHCGALFRNMEEAFTPNIQNG